MDLRHVIFLTALCTACNPAKEDDAAETPATVTGNQPTSEIIGTGALSVNALASAYPEGLAVSAFPKSLDETPGQAAPGTLQIDTTLALQELPPLDGNQQQLPPADQQQGGGGSEGSFDPFKQHPKKRLEDAQKRLDGTADSCFSSEIELALGTTPNIKEICYGFDYGMASGTAKGLVDGGRINPALANMENQTTAELLAALEAIPNRQVDTSGEVCMVATGRHMISSVVNKVDAALQLFQGMLCQAKKDGLASELPAVGASLNLDSVFSNYGSNAPNPMTFSNVAISRKPDINGRAVYQSNVTFSVSS